MDKLEHSEFIKRIRNIENNLDLSKTKYKSTRKKVTVTCPKHGDIEMWPNILLRGGSCRKCYNDNQSTNIKDYVDKARKVHGDKYDYSKTIYTRSYNKATMTCPKHGDFKILLSAHLGGDRCKKCTLEERSYDTKEFIKRAKEVHGDKYDYSKTKFKVTRDKVRIKCPEHGEFKQIANVHLRGSGCPTCNSSKGEIRIMNVLNKYSIRYKQEVIIDDNFKQHKYDFYLPDFNLLVEYDGIQHFKSVKHFGGKNKLLEQKRRDKFKNELANKLKYRLFRIPYTKYNKIEEHLMVYLSKIFYYRYNGIYYKNLLEIVKGLNMSKNTTLKDLRSYRLYKGDS